MYAEGASQAKRVKIEVEPAPVSNDNGSSSVVISEALSKFLGTGEKEMIRSEALRRVWEYIKVNHLEVGSPAAQILHTCLVLLGFSVSFPVIRCTCVL